MEKMDLIDVKVLIKIIQDDFVPPPRSCDYNILQ